MTSTTNSNANFPVIPGYSLVDRFYHSDRPSVYRAIEGLSGRAVIIKLLHQNYPSFTDLLQFRNQYTIAQNLQIPNIIRPDRLSVYGNSYILVMADFGSISLQEYCQGQVLAVSETLTIALKLAAILHDLHQANVIHKDIKPANITIQPQSQQIQIIDFSISSLLPKETQPLKPPNCLEGTLAYLAPEQTGRMNRGIDYRTDFYSLGVTLYELLTGELPFRSIEPLELVYCQIARTPTPIAVKQPTVPTMVAAIVAKLMAKNAEERYQSAVGLQNDLKICLEQWEATGAIAEFKLGMQDLSDRFTIPECLYGRERAVQTLLESFERVRQGATELVLVTGCSGIGKTAVVNEVHKPITRQQGYFIKGKFDQFNRNMPLSAFVRALRDLVWQLLGESDTQLDRWKTSIQAALGENAQVIIDVIPELEQMIGAQPPASELAGTAAQHRFNLLFQKFVCLFATAAHPLTIFLDDLQWADSVSLQSLQLLLEGGLTSHLLLIGTYRDNEVSPAHPLLLTLAEIGKLPAQLQTIAIAPLEIDTLDRLVADTLGCPAVVARPLTELIYQKTQGNPFFAIQFLKALHHDRQITFVGEAGHWQCDLTQVRAAALTDNVVAFMALQLQKLPIATQEVLKLAACLGDRFDLATLAIVSAQPADRVAAALWQALQVGLVIPQNEVYKFFGNGLVADDLDRRRAAFALAETAYRFLHDRVRQAAYSLIPEDRKQLEQLQIGRLLLAHWGERERGIKLFDIVDRLNIGCDLIVDPAELLTLGRLNLAAAQKARLSTAYQAALDYASTGIELFAATGWQQQYDLMLALHHVAAETAFLQGEFDRATNLVEIVLQQAHTTLDRVPVYETQIQLLTLQKNYRQAALLGLQILAELGIKLPAQPSKFYLSIALVKTKLRLHGKSSETLLALPLTTDPHQIAAMRILCLISYPAYFYSQPLLGAISMVGVRRSITGGNSIWSARLYSLYSVVMTDVNDFAASYNMGRLALQLLDRLPNLAIEAQVKFGAAFCSEPCQRPASDSLQLLQSAMQAAVASGDLLYAGVAYYGDCALRMVLSEPLDELLATTIRYRQAAMAMKDRSSLFLLDLVDRLFSKIHQPDLDPAYLFDSEATDLQTIAELEANGERSTLAILYAYKAYLCFIFEDLPTALKYADLYAPFERENSAMYVGLQMVYIDGLIRLAVYPTSSPQQQRQLLDRVTQIQTILTRRAKFVPASFQARQDLLAAERCRVLGQNTQAIELYDRSISSATAAKDLQQAALGNELAAKFYLSWGKAKVAAGYMQEAYYCYLSWGAIAKTTDLANRYPQLLAPILCLQQPEFDPLATLASITDSVNTERQLQHQSANYFDLVSVLQSAQALTSTLDLSELLARLMQIVQTSSGAQTCLLAIPNLEGEWQIRPSATPNPLSLPQPLTVHCDYPINSIYWVINTKQTLAIDATQPLEIPDRYLLAHQPRSVLCVPIVKHAEICGVLYLEHRQTADIFTLERKTIVAFLCAQAAIAIEQAQIYQASQRQQTYLETLLDNIPHMAWLKDEYRRYVAVNRVLAKVAGCEPIELIGKTDFDFWPRELAQAAQADDLRVMESGKRQAIEEKILRSNGEYHWVETIKTPITNSVGQLTGTVGIARDITERRLMELALRDSQRQYQQLADNIPGIIYQLRMTPDGTVTYPYVSSGCQQLLEVSPAAVMQDPRCLLDLIHPDDREMARQLLVESARDLQPRSCEGRAVLASGAVKWVKSVSRPELQPDGAIVWDGVMLDITDRKVVEQALSESQKQYQQLADNIPGAIYQFRVAPDGSSCIPYMSSGCQDLFELPAATVIADSNRLVDLTHPDDLRSFYQSVTESARNLTFFEWEGRVLLPSGKVKWIELNSRPELQPDGSIVWDGVMLDITERKQAELNLAASQQKYHSLIQSIPGVVWEYDFVLHKFSFVNDRAEELLGFPIEAWLTQPDFWADRLHPADRDATIQAFSDAIDNRQTCEAEYRLLAADGRIVWVYDIATPVLDSQGKLIATNGLLLDITEERVALHDRQQAELALQETNERLESTNQELTRATRLKDEFLATMSHELRTPLNAILGMSECLQEGVFGEINHRQAKSIETIHRSGQHLLSLINDILDVSKIVAGKLELELTTVSLRSLCESSLAFVKQQADRKQIHIQLDLPAEIGQICVDERRMRQVAINLLSNAVKFTPKAGSIALTAKIVTAADLAGLVPLPAHSTQAEWVCISVTDTGIGISPADRDRLFQPFVQIDSSLSRQYEGTGLGLALVKQMVELHGGYVTLESELGVGSCFNIYLIYDAGDRHQLPALAPHDRLPSAPHLDRSTRAAQTTILLAEDNQTNLITFVSYLNVKGYRTIAAKDGAEAIALAQAHHPDLILMDIQLPGMDGIEAIIHIRQDPQLANIPIVALTALAMTSDRDRCLNAGADRFLTKPVKLKELNSTIQQCLNLN